MYISITVKRDKVATRCTHKVDIIARGAVLMAARARQCVFILYLCVYKP